LIIDDEKGHPDLLGKKELGRELEIKGIVTLFHGRIFTPFHKNSLDIGKIVKILLYICFFY